MKRLIALLLALVMVLLLCACGNSSSSDKSDSDTSSKDEGKEAVVDYRSVTADIESAINAIENCASIQHDWLGVSNNLPYLYDDDNYEGGNNSDAQRAGKSCYNYRQEANKKLENAKNGLKGGSGEYYSAVQEYYLAATAYLSFISNFPEGYTKATWAEKWTELKQNCNNAKDKVSLFE